VVAERARAVVAEVYLPASGESVRLTDVPRGQRLVVDEP
jgi:hypothetical protein